MSWVFVAARAAVWYGFLFALIAAELYAARAMKRLVEQPLHHPSNRAREDAARAARGSAAPPQFLPDHAATPPIEAAPGVT